MGASGAILQVQTIRKKDCDSLNDRFGAGAAALRRD
jgi:hypothetical protein